MVTWKLALPKDSIDGQPLVTTIEDLLWKIDQFPYHRIPPSTTSTTTNTIAGYFLRPPVVLGALFIYVVLSKPFMKYLRHQVFHWDRTDNSNSNNNSSSSNGKNTTTTIWIPYSWFQYFIIFHNAILALFSAICAYCTIDIIVHHTRTYGIYSTYCDVNGTFWNDSGFGSWAYLFYLSKYYEFVDTWILILKGKPASFLQVYHHTGIVFIMYCAVLSQSAWLLFVVSLNAIIHTFMYTYFCIKSISPTTELSIAKYLTMAQIGQFLTGILCTIPIFIYGQQCDTASSRFALACLHIYGFGLIALFITFAQKKYLKKDV